MEAEPPEVISAEPSRFAVKGPRLIGVALVLVVLAAAVVTVVRDHGEAAALRHQLRSPVRQQLRSPVRQQLRSPVRQQAALARRPQVSSAVYPLRAGGPVTGEVTVFSVRFPRGTDQVLLTAHLSGARPHTRYQLVGTDCTRSNASGHAWASGTSGAHGTVQLAGPGHAVAPGDYYAVELTPSSLRSGPGLHGYLSSAGGLSPFRDGYAPCAP